MTDKERGRVIYFLLALLILFELVVLFVRSGSFPGISKRTDILKAYASAALEDIRIIPGDILDRNGDPVVENRIDIVETEDAEDQKSEKTEEKRVTEYHAARAYSQLVGFTGIRSLNINADTPEDAVGGRRDYRLMRFLDDAYWDPNGLYSTVDSEGTKGQSAVLTVDNGLQEAVYDAMLAEIDDRTETGSAVVLDAKTGEILSMVAFPAYDFNDVGTAMKEMKEAEEELKLEPSDPVSYKNPEVPGSIFKVLMSVALIDHDMEDFAVKNKEYVVNGWKCGPTSFHFDEISLDEGDTVDLSTALKTSANVYFAKAAIALGEKALNETAAGFMFTEKGEEEAHSGQGFLLDCGNVPFSWNLDVERDVLAQTGMGQGRTEMTALQAAMIAQAIANDGKMMKPYVIRSLADANGKTVYEGAPELLSEATGKETADKVTAMMAETALINSARHDLTEVHDLFAQYGVAGKTGTGEVPVLDENGEIVLKNNAWFMSFAPADDPQYVVVVNQCRTDKSGYEVMPVAAEIYKYLFEKY